MIYGTKRHKYNAKRTVYEGKSFPSRLEASVYALLRLQERAGEISELECQPTVYLTKAKISYKPDFMFIKDGETCYGEAKGKECDRFRLIKRLWAFYGPGPMYLYKGRAERPHLDKVIIPETDPHTDTP